MPQETPLHPTEFPKRITLELTNRCNLRCTFCPRKFMGPDQGFLDTNLGLRLIDEIASHAPRQVVPFFRGEPLLHPDWARLLESLLAKAGLEVQFTTNATLLDESAAARLVALSPQFVSFSLDTMDPALYNSMRKGADFELTMANVLRFLELNAAHGSQTMIQVSTVETEAHKAGMEAFVKFWTPLVDRVRVYEEHSADGHLGSVRSQQSGNDTRRPCQKPFTDMVIYYSGQVALCNHDWTRDAGGEGIGDVRTASIAEIWSGTSYRNIRDRHLEANLEGTAPCEHCDHWRVFYLEKGLSGRVYTRQEAMS